MIELNKYSTPNLMHSMALHHHYFQQPEQLAAFLDFTPKVFEGVHFDDWFHRKGWQPNYQAYSFFEGGRVVSNVSVTELDLVMDGQAVRALQFATVATLPEYRNQGLAAKLMHHVLDEFEDKVDLFYLFANDTVLNFYPKFGFKRFRERLFFADYPEVQFTPGMQKLEVYREQDWQILERLSQKRIPLTHTFGSTNDGLLLLWHALYSVPHCLWYVAEKDALIIGEVLGKTLQVYDVVQTKAGSFNELIPYLGLKDMEAICFWFTPDQIDIKTNMGKHDVKESPLFVRGNFSLPSRTFKYPSLGHS